MSLCCGNHQRKTWTTDEIFDHMLNEPCIDCYCGIPFKKIKDKKK